MKQSHSELESVLQSIKGMNYPELEEDIKHLLWVMRLPEAHRKIVSILKKREKDILARIKDADNPSVAMSLKESLIIWREVKELFIDAVNRQFDSGPKPTSFDGLVKLVATQKFKEDEGRLNELNKLAKNKIYDEWSKPQDFGNNNWECPIFTPDNISIGEV